MSTRAASRRKGLWSGLGPTPRLIAGALIIIATGMAGLMPREVWGMTIPWPYAAFWGAVGWGRVGLSLRPMILLVLFGLAQDIGMNAPLGCFALINLIVYGLSALVADTVDVRQPLAALLAPFALFFAGFLMCWILAGFLSNHLTSPLMPLTTMLFTGAVYGIIHRAFDLGRRPGEIEGRGA
jgi:hypothetical protein